MAHVVETMLNLLRRDGYSVGSAGVVLADGRSGVIIDAEKQGHRWAVIAADPYKAAGELMITLGWDLEG